MIKRFKLLSNLGQFKNDASGSHISLGRLTLCYAGNGRGKTTLATALSSLASGDPRPLLERRRVDVQEDPKVVIETDSPQGMCHFTNRQWNTKLPNVVVFDDNFVDRNVFSGLSVSPQQRQNLHDIILGKDAVTLQRRLNEQVHIIEMHNSEMRSKEAPITGRVPGNLGVVEIFNLPEDPQIDAHIDSTESLLQAAKDDRSIRNAPTLKALSLPHFDMARIEQVLQMGLADIEAEALKRVQMHIEHLGDGAEGWLSEGMRYIQDGKQDGAGPAKLCPFCGQELNGSHLIETYQKFFSYEYDSLKKTVGDLLYEVGKSFGDALRAKFEQELRVVNESYVFWQKFLDIKPLSLATTEIFEDCAHARESVLRLVEAKQLTPLEKLDMTDEVRGLVNQYSRHVYDVEQSMANVNSDNKRIGEFKAKLEASNLEDLETQLILLRAIKTRHTPEVGLLCDEFLAAKREKAEAEKERDAIRNELNRYRRDTFVRYQQVVNQHLTTFGASFRLDGLKHVNIRRGSTSTYEALINKTVVGVVGTQSAEPEPSFGTVFSAGDRATLALAFFVASINQMEHQEGLVVVLDDPISSLDVGRRLATTQLVRQLANRVAQVIVFSHDKGFLCRMWNGRGGLNVVPIEISRHGDGSTLKKWDITSEFLTEHDKRDSLFNSYLSTGHGNEREIAREIRNHLEGYLRVSCPSAFPPNTALGRQFIKECRERLGEREEILSEEKLYELCNLLEYTSGFHHDTNPAWESQAIDSNELA